MFFFVSYFVFYLERYWTFNLTFNYSHFVKECKTLDTVATFFWNVYLNIKISYFKFIKGRDERPQTTFVCALLLSFVSFPQSSKAQMSFCRSFELCAFFFCFVSISLSVLWLRLELELRPKSRLEKKQEKQKHKRVYFVILLWSRFVLWFLLVYAYFFKAELLQHCQLEIFCS